MTRITRSSSSFGFRLVETCDDALIVCLNNIFWNAFHTKYLDIESLSTRQGIVDTRQGLFVNLIHMNGQTSCGIQSATTSFAFEMFSFLVRDEDLQVIEITLTIIAPWPSQQLLNIGMTALLLAHLTDR